ncbi:MAG TPA: recombinase family protein [Ktedonobacterales bacterium]
MNQSYSMVLVVAGYVRRSTHMQIENFSSDAQKRAIRNECQRRRLPEPIFYEDDEYSAKGEQIASRPAFGHLLEEVLTGRVQMIMVHSLDRWSRNVLVTLQTFRILAEKRCAFVSLTEHIDYSTPEGKLQLTILAAFAAYFSDTISKHISKGKAERAAQGLYNGDISFGYRWAGPKLPPEHDPVTFPGLRLMGELRMQGLGAEQIAEAVNAAGYRTGGKRNRERLFTKDTINLILRNEFYAAFAPGDDRGTVLYHGQRHRGLHPAAFSVEEWQKIRELTRLHYSAPLRTGQARRFYEFAGYVVSSCCGLPLHGLTKSEQGESRYYKDAAKLRKLPCPVGGCRVVRADLIQQQFGELLAGLKLPDSWREELRQQVAAGAAAGMKQAEVEDTNIARERERLRLKRARILTQHHEGYIDNEEMQAEIAVVESALGRLSPPTSEGLSLEAVLEAGERLPGIVALWEVATPEERRELITLLLEAGGLCYDLERKMIAAIKPRPVWLPILRLAQGTVERKEAKGILVLVAWQ